MRVIYTDGSGTSRGTSAYCIILDNWCVPVQRPSKVKWQNKLIKILPEDMNVHEIEYLALLEAMKLIELPTRIDYIIYMDSLPIVRAIKGEIQPSETKKKQQIEVIKHMIEIRGNKVKIEWVPREKNLAGIYLEKRLKKINRYLNNSVRTRPYLHSKTKNK